MKRKPALAMAAAVALTGAAGVVALAAVTGANVFGFHFGSARAATVVGTASPSTTAEPDPATAGDDTVATLAPLVVMQTEFVDQYVTVTTASARSAAAPQSAGRPDAQAPTGTPAPAASRPPAATAAPVTPAATAAPGAPAPTNAPVTAAPTTQPTTPPATTRFDRSKYPFKITIPSGWGSKPVPPLPTPSAGRQWSECELHDTGWWECQYP